MPPLEYVGASTPLDVPLREGDRVLLRGLSKKELNGQKGTLQNFAQAQQGRLAVKLDSGQRVSIKPENLGKLEPESNGSFVDASCPADDSDMPPLEYVGAAATPNVDGKQHSQGSAATETGRHADDDGEMPPLEYVGTAPAASSRSSAAKQEDEDDMPPLEYVGASTPLDVPLREGDRVLLKGLSKKELNGQKGTLQSFAQAQQGRLAVKLDSGQRVSIKPENLGKLEPESNGGFVDASFPADDSDMPPLEYVGAASTPNGVGKQHSQGSAATEAGRHADEEGEMPPLEYVGTAPAASSRSSAGKQEDEDDMPPLEYVGASTPLDVPLREGDRVLLKGLSKKELNGQKGTLQSFAQAQQGRLAVKLDSGQRVSIKPENLGRLEPESNGSFVNASCPADDTDMPPLEYVGAAATPNVDGKQQSRGSAVTTTGRHADDDGEMPALEYVGTAPAASSRSSAGKQEDEDDMPPLEYVGASTPLDVPLREGDRVLLKGLSKKELNGQKGTLQSFAQAQQGRLAVKLDSGQRVSIKPENLGKLEPESNGSFVDASCPADDSDMPPLEYVGAASTPNVVGKQHSQGSAVTATGCHADDDGEMPPLEYVGTAPAASSRSSAAKKEDEDDMPPLEYVGASTPLDVPLREGDRVLLRGLSKKELNGQKGTLQSFAQAQQGRLAVKLDSGQRVSIKPENLGKLEPESNGGFVDASCPADDSDMPPLEYVGAASTLNGVGKQHSQGGAATEAGRNADDEDEMPPLEYVGTAPAASSRSSAGKQEDEDDMPPLEYVGASTPLDVPLREGDRVLLKGLSKKELNGQKGTLQSFAQAQQGRLAVKLDSGQRVSIKPENLGKLEPESNGSFVDASCPADDSDMPPLEYVGAASTPNVDGKQHSQGSAATEVGRHADDEDEMPPLEYVGTAPAASSRSSAGKQEDEDDMPPLEYVGASTPLDVPLREGDRVLLRGLSKKELNGQKGTLQSFAQAQQGRLAVKLDSGQRVSIKPENLGQLEPESNGSFVDASCPADGSDMPPLEYVGAASTPNVVGKQHSQGSAATEAGRHADDDGEMPPLEYVGTAPAASSRSSAGKQEDEDDMPPLEYVGASTQHDVPLREGDRVLLKGLSKKELNGQKGTLQSFAHAQQGRLAVKLDSGQRVSIKPENLGQLEPESNGSFVDASCPADDSDMPPLEYVGVAQNNSNMPPLSYVAAGASASTAPAKQDDDDDMPPLEYVGQDLSAGLSLLEGDRVRLKGLSKAGLDGQVGQLQSFARATKGRLPVKLDSGQLLAVKTENLEKLVACPHKDQQFTHSDAKTEGAHQTPCAKAANGRRDGTGSGKSAERRYCPDSAKIHDEDVPPLEPDDSASSCDLHSTRNS